MQISPGAFHALAGPDAVSALIETVQKCRPHAMASSGETVILTKIIVNLLTTPPLPEDGASKRKNAALPKERRAKDHFQLRYSTRPN
jgi:hypothetical protein